jgi:TetR/AcrR family transcriptional repressor of nem operon
MGRTVTFDQEAALVAALETFWQRGYGASSVQVLLDAMHLGRGSVYNTFGDKESLFRAALDLYFERNTAVVIALLETTANPVEGIYGVFEWTLTALPSALQRRGCILVNAVAELSETNRELAEHAFGHIRKVRDAMAHALKRARRHGLWCEAEADAHVVADLLFHFLTGLRVTTRLHADPSEIRRSVLAALELVGLDTRGFGR